MREEITRSTAKERRDPALKALGSGIDHYADERFGSALRPLREAKKLAPRSSTVRELLGLAAYRSELWEEALRELRTFRRLTGETIHMPVELDCLRALGRGDDVRKTWLLLEELGVSKATSHEARVVYGSFLLDEGQISEAWRIVKPARLIASPSQEELRQWFVAARVAIAAADRDAALKIISALEHHDADFEGVDELRALLG